MVKKNGDGGEILRCSHINNDEIVLARLDPPVQFDGAGGKRQFFFEVGPRLRRIMNPSRILLHILSFG